MTLPLMQSEPPSSLKRKKGRRRPPRFPLPSAVTSIVAAEAIDSSRLVIRKTSLMWEAENDPFQVFEVEHESCLDLEVTVHRGEEISKGYYKDLIDIPDPYVIVRVPGSSNSSKRTSHVNNNVNPFWNETFHFFVDPKKENPKLEVKLMEANHFQDDTLGTTYFDMDLLELNKPKDHCFEFENSSKVHTTILMIKNEKPDLRFSLALCEEEKTFLRQRRLKVLAQMQSLLKDKAPKNKDEVPIVAVLGSGGGFRAMTCFSAAVKVLHQSGILDCTTYITGLSGSSWFISTLYSHDKFPDVTDPDIYEDLKTSVTQDWKWNILNGVQYIFAMMEKNRRGQPISFTDIFGHLLGDVLLKGKKEKKLTDQRTVVANGKVPFPLYTCLHAKASVSCKSFSEWIEFSPYEIGIAKYGTFMKTEHFGSKFIVGKLIKHHPEFPLHYLQGVWGSAFTILMKRLVFNGSQKQDIVQMMREEGRDLTQGTIYEERELTEKLVSSAHSHEKDSETDEDENVVGNDDKNEAEIEAEEIHQILSSVTQTEFQTEDECDKQLSKNQVKKGFSFELLSANTNNSQNERKISDPGIKMGGLRRADAFKRSRPGNDTNVADFWANKRKVQRTKKQRRSSILQNMMKNSSMLNSRAGRAGEILNPFRGLSLKNSFPISPFSISDEVEEDDTWLGEASRYDALDHKAKKLFIVDSGLAFNSPFPLLLRPQRAVDMYLSFDFSQRPSDRSMPFKELILAEKWARLNHVAFPPVDELAKEFSQDPEVKELYVFKDPKNPNCPVILHFTIVNNTFKMNKAPGVPRETFEETDFADFTLFDEPTQPYASTNFVYDDLQYERLFRLVEYNTLAHIEDIKREIEEIVELKRTMMADAAKYTLLRMQKVVSACTNFRRSGNLSLKVNGVKGKQFLRVCRDSLRREAEDEGATFYDAQESLDRDSSDEDSRISEEDLTNGVTKDCNPASLIKTVNGMSLNDQSESLQDSFLKVDTELRTIWHSCKHSHS